MLIIHRCRHQVFVSSLPSLLWANACSTLPDIPRLSDLIEPSPIANSAALGCSLPKPPTKAGLPGSTASFFDAGAAAEPTGGAVAPLGSAEGAAATASTDDVEEPA